MRIWTLHPKYLDPKGLVALWRETLLAQKVLRGKTHGYRRHPQLRRFQAQDDPVACVATYLRAVGAEARRRGYSFNCMRINRKRSAIRIPVTRGQLLYEWKHFCEKLKIRDPFRFRELQSIARPRPHPMFRVVPGEIEPWEVVRS